jgi:hypothetical protein
MSGNSVPNSLILTAAALAGAGFLSSFFSEEEEEGSSPSPNPHNHSSITTLANKALKILNDGADSYQKAVHDYVKNLADTVAYIPDEKKELPLTGNTQIAPLSATSQKTDTAAKAILPAAELGDKTHQFTLVLNLNENRPMAASEDRDPHSQDLLLQLAEEKKASREKELKIARLERLLILQRVELDRISSDYSSDEESLAAPLNELKAAKAALQRHKQDLLEQKQELQKFKTALSGFYINLENVNTEGRLEDLAGNEAFAPIAEEAKTLLKLGQECVQKEREQNLGEVVYE